MKKGDRFYRYKFDINDHTVRLEVFELTGEESFIRKRKRYEAVRVSPPGDKTIHIHKDSLSVVANKKNCKYVLLDHESVDDAIRELEKLVKNRFEFHYIRVTDLGNWLKWLDHIAADVN